MSLRSTRKSNPALERKALSEEEIYRRQLHASHGLAPEIYNAVSQAGTFGKGCETCGTKKSKNSKEE